MDDLGKLSKGLDVKKAKLNITISIVSKILLLIVSFGVRRLLIQYIGNEANGLISLFTNIIGVMSIAELGIGTAITYCMYDPIVNGDFDKVAALYCLFKRIYTIIGIIILAVGTSVCPLLPILANGYDMDFSCYLSYMFVLLGTVVTYMYSAKTSLINAYKNDYVSTIITSIGSLTQYVLQIAFIIITKSFVLYSLCFIVSALIQWVLFASDRKYKDITARKIKIDGETKINLVKNIKAMFLHKVGAVIFSSVDSLVISATISVVVLGYYSNYILIQSSMNGIIKLIFTSLTSVLGHMGVTASVDEKKKCFNFFYLMNFMFGMVFYLGYFAVVDELVTMVLGEGLLLDEDVVIIITLTYFIQYMRQAASVFKDAFGLFYHDRWNSLIAALCNVALSILLSIWLGISGVLLATIIVDMLLYHTVEPFVLYKYGFNETPWKYYLKNYSLIIFFAVLLYLFSLIKINTSDILLKFFIDGLLSLAVTIPICLFIVLTNKNLKKNLKLILKNKKNL